MHLSHYTSYPSHSRNPRLCEIVLIAREDLAFHDWLNAGPQRLIEVARMIDFVGRAPSCERVSQRFARGALVFHLLAHS